MNDKIRQHLIAHATKNNWSTDDDTLLEILTEASEVFTKKVSDSRWWYTEFIVVEVDGMLIGYEYAKANRDEHVRDLGWEFDESTICEVEAVQEMVTIYRKLTPAKGAVTHTMNTDPNNAQAAPANQESIAEQAAAGEAANAEAVNEQANAVESAAQDAAVGATEE